MSKWHKIELIDNGDGQQQIKAALHACAGAPVVIRPGTVVALASAIEAFLHNWSDETGASNPDYESVEKARAALAMYNGEEDQ